MMVSEKDTKGIRKFVCGQLRGEPDLSTLTVGILKKRYLAHVGCESLSPEAKNFMKQVVKEELMKMQDNDEDGSEVETVKPRNKRKREKEKDEVISGREDESTAKKSRRQSSLSSESEDKEDRKTGSEESEDEEQMKSESEDAEQEVKKSEQKTKNSEDSTDEDINKSEDKGNESNCDDSPKEIVIKKANAAKNGETKSSNTSEGKKKAQSDEENESDADSKSEKSDKINSNDSSDDSETEENVDSIKKKEKVSVEKKNNDTDSDSSSLPSLEDEQHSGEENTPDDKKKNKKKKKKKNMKNEKSTKSEKDDKAVVRLKHYISLCGLRPNYKKLLDGCHSVRSQVAFLKKELEDLGVEGQPSVKKCKTVQLKREETQELAELDVNNIIATKGRPKRRAASAWQEKRDPPSSAYLRTLDSGSDSGEDNNTHRGRRVTDWANLQGIISDDADSE